MLKANVFLETTVVGTKHLRCYQSYCK